MIRLRKILLCDYIYYILLFICFISYFINNNIDHNYIKTSNRFKIIDIKKDKDKRILILKGKHKIRATLYDSIYKKDLNLGGYITINYEEIKIDNPSVPNTFNYKKYLYSNKIYKTIKINRIIKVENCNNIFYKIKNILIKRMNRLDKSKGYVYSLIFGDNSYINDDVLSSYRKNGISHLFAISGLHISILTGVLYKILKRIKEEKRQSIIIAFLLFYMFITGFTPSSTRGCIFSILVILNKKYYFNIKTINLLLLTLSIIMIFNPLAINNIGMQYSFIATLFLIKLSNIINKSKHKLLITSLVAFLSTFPITVNNFYQINFISILYNLIFVPFVSIIFLPIIMLTYIFPFLDKITYLLIFLLEESSYILSNVNILCINFCKMSMSIICIYYLSIYLMLSKCKFKHIFMYLILIICLYFMPFHKKNEIIFLDVGQGDSTLLYVNRQLTLIDTGGVVMYDDNDYTYQITTNKTIPYMKSKGYKKIDNLILTHGDYDHMGEAINIVNNFKVEKVIFNCGAFNDLESELIKVLDKKKIKYYSCIKELNIDKNKLQFLQTKVYDNENDNSNVIYTELNGYKFMFMGDASNTTEQEILNKYNLSDIDVLKVGHHGSRTSSSKEFINGINPKYSVISVGKNNRYSHPNKEVLVNLENSKIYRTDQDGSIMFKIKNNKLKIETCSP